jgi:hypothetical protein
MAQKGCLLSQLGEYLESPFRRMFGLEMAQEIYNDAKHEAPLFVLAARWRCLVRRPSRGVVVGEARQERRPLLHRGRVLPEPRRAAQNGSAQLGAELLAEGTNTRAASD